MITRNYPKKLYVPRLEVLDFDKTLVNTRALQLTLEADVQLHGIDSEALRSAREATAGFDTVRWLREKAGASEAQLRDIHAMFIATVKKIGAEHFFMPGAREVLQRLDDLGAHSLILTTGGGEWQYWKLKAMGLSDHPFHITAGRRKAELIAQSFDKENGRYELDGIVGLPDGAEVFVFDDFSLIDDHPLAFAEMPTDARGFHIAHDSDVYRANDGEKLAPNVRRILGFEDYLAYLEKQYS